MRHILPTLQEEQQVCQWKRISRSSFVDILRSTKVIIEQPLANFRKYWQYEDNAPYGHYLCPCEEGDLEPVKIRRSAGGSFEYFIFCRQTGEEHILPPEEQHLWRLDFTAFLRFLSMCFKCSLDTPRGEANGLWSLGRSKDFIHGVQRQFFFAMTLTPAIQETFSREKTAILLLGSDERKPDGEVGKRIFYLPDVVSIQKGHVCISKELMADSVRSQAVQNEKPSKNVVIQRRLKRLTDIVHEYLLEASKYYWEKNEVGTIRMKLKKYTAKQLLADYQRKYPDDEFTDTVLRKMIDYKPGIHKQPGAELQLRLMWSVWLKDVELVQAYKDSQVNGRRIRDIDQHREENDDNEESWSYDYISKEQQEELCHQEGIRVRKGT